MRLFGPSRRAHSSSTFSTSTSPSTSPSTRRVWVFGDNSVGQLGMGERSLVQRPHELPSLSALSPKWISSGGSHSVAVDSEGRLWSCGSATHFQSGHTRRVTQWTKLTALPQDAADTTFTSVVAGHVHSLMTDTRGRVYSCGSARHSQLGYASERAEECRVVALPAFLPSLERVLQVSSLLLHSLAVTSKGDLWAWGDNALGQLGDGSQDSAVTPQRVSLPHVDTHVVDASAGATHSLALSSSGVVWGWGANRHGQLGGVTSCVSLSPVPLTALTSLLLDQSLKEHVHSLKEHVVAVHAGLDYSLVRTSRGRVLACGQNAQGQLGTGTSRLEERTWVALKDLPPIRSLSVGARHTLAVTEEGQLWAWGLGSEGQLGEGRSVRHLPKPIALTLNQGERVVFAAVGESQSFVITEL